MNNNKIIYYRFFNLLFIVLSLLLCIQNVNSNNLREEDVVSKIAYSRRVGKVNTYVELICTATEAKPECKVPDSVKIIQPKNPSKVSAKVEAIPDSLLVAAAKNNPDTQPPFERPSFRVTLENKDSFDIRLTSSATLLIYNQQSASNGNDDASIPELYVRHAPKRSPFRPGVFVDMTQQVLDLYQTTLQDAARGSDDVFNSGALVTYVFGPALNSFRHTLHFLPKIYPKYGYENEKGEITKDISDEDLSLTKRLTPTMCDRFVELQYWTAAIENIFIEHTYDPNKRDQVLANLFGDESPSDLPGEWQLPDERNPCRRKKDGDVTQGGHDSILALRGENNMLAPGEAGIAKAQTEAYLLGSNIGYKTKMITSPLVTKINLNDKDKAEFQQFKKDNSGSKKDDLSGGLMLGFVEEKATKAKKHLRRLLAENRESWWNRGKEEVQQQVHKHIDNGKKYVNNIKKDFSDDGLFSKNGVNKVKDEFFKKKPTNPFAKGDGSFTVSMTHEQYKAKNGLSGTKDRAYLNLNHMHNDNRKMETLRHLESTGWQNSKKAKDLRAELINKRDPMDDVEFGTDNEVIGDWGKDKASSIKIGAHVKKGGVKAGFFVKATAKLGNIIRKKGGAEATATVTGFVEVDKKLQNGGTIKTGLFVTRTVGFKEGKVTNTKNVRGNVKYKSKDGWEVQQDVGFTSEGEGDVKVNVKTKFKDSNAFGINGLCVTADIGFTCHKKANGEFEFEGQKKPNFKFTYNPSFQPKWIKDLRNAKKNYKKFMTNTKKKFKSNTKYTSSELESLHKESMRSNRMNQNSEWSALSFGGDMDVMMKH